MDVFVVQVIHKDGNTHVIEVFSNKEKAEEYQNEMMKLYPITTDSPWYHSFCGRTVDQEALNLTGLKEHQEKYNDPEWCKQWNTSRIDSGTEI